MGDFPKFGHILSCTKSLLDHLQSPQTNLAKACDIISATVETLQLLRTDEEWDNRYKYITESASLFGIDVAPCSPHHTRQVPRRLLEGILIESIV